MQHSTEESKPSLHQLPIGKDTFHKENQLQGRELMATFQRTGNGILISLNNHNISSWLSTHIHT